MTSYVPGTSARSFDATRDLSAWSIEHFLTLNDWTREEESTGVYSVWASASQEFSLLLPYNEHLRDYGRRFSEALETLSEFCGLAGEALALEVVAARKDIFLLRADQSTRDGSIPFQEAQRLVNGVDDLLKTAAAATIRPRASTAGRKPALVTNFMADDVRMGHTLHGSFVLTVLASDAAEDARRFQAWERRVAGVRDETREADHPLEDAAPSFSRQVMSTLATGLATSKKLLTEPATGAAIEDAIESGVTLQMLKSIKTMAKSDGLRSLDMAFKWSLLEPAESAPTERVQLTREESSVSDALLTTFSKKPDEEDDSIVGSVTRLERADGAADGVVVVEGVVGKNRRKVKIPLSGDAYKRAIAAHEDYSRVVVKGTFTRKSRGWQMAPGARIGVVADPPSD